MIRWREEIVQKLSLDYKKCWVLGPELSAPRYLLESVSCWLQSVGQLTRGQPGPGLGPVLGSQLSSQPRVRSPLHPSAHGWLSLTGMTISPPNHQQHPTLGSSNCLHGILSIMVSDWIEFEIQKRMLVEIICAFFSVFSRIEETPEVPKSVSVSKQISIQWCLTSQEMEH